MREAGPYLSCKKKPHSRWAVMISGRGSNLQALLNIRNEVNIALVLSSKKSAYGLKRANREGVPVITLPMKIDWTQLNLLLHQYQIDFIFLAGFMKMIPESFVEQWENRIINVHPSLLPSYPGLNSIERSFFDKKNMGVTVHVVTAEMDAGPILKQKIVVSENQINQSSLENARLRIHLAEHRLVQEVIQKWS